MTSHLSTVDRQPTRPGTGWISGLLAVAIGLLCVAAVLCLHFPQWLTLPELRSLYPLPLVRQAIDWSIRADAAVVAAVRQSIGPWARPR